MSVYDRKLRLTIIVVPLIFILFFLYKEDHSVLDLAYLVSILILLCATTELLLKLGAVVWQPINEIDGENVVDTLVKSINTESKWVTLACLVLSGVMMCRQLNPFTLACNSAPLMCLSVIFTYLLLRDLLFLQHPLTEPLKIESLKGLDYGSGMAYSYYHSYLRIILPSTGRQNKGLVEKMETYEGREGIEFSSKKLFVLIPSSSYIPPDLKEASNGWMEAAKELEVEILDRCGVKRRKYQNSVYKIYLGGPSSNKKPVYVVAEGATPVFTFYEIQSHSHPQSLVYRKHRTEIIQMFYRTLQDLLHKDPQCRDICELIYYSDYDPFNQRVNIAKIILQRIQDIKQRTDFT